jgi:hypothetical protein
VTVGPEEQVTSSTASEANRPLTAVELEGEASLERSDMGKDVDLGIG